MGTVIYNITYFDSKLNKETAELTKEFETEIIVYDLFKDEKVAEEMRFKYVELDELLAKSDIISLHCPLTKETEHIICKENIEKMKNVKMKFYRN